MRQIAKESTARIADIPATAVLAVIALLGAAVQYPGPLNHDAAWHFHTAFRLIEGDRIGIDIFDINPPMSMWLFSLPALAAKATGVSPGLVFKTFTLAVCLVSCLASIRLLRLLRPGEYELSIAVLGIAGALFLLPGYDFAQREHLVAALALPYVLSTAARAENLHIAARYAAPIGCAAAIGICIKPYFLAFAVSLELWLLWQSRSARNLHRPELATIVVAGFIYLAAIAIFAPAYYTRVLPDATSNYGGFGVSLPETLRSIASYLAVAACGLALALRAWGRRPLPREAQACLAAALGFLFAAILQQKGWRYQIYPAAMYIACAVGFLLAEKAARQGVAALAAAAVMVFAFVAPSSALIVEDNAEGGTSARVEALVRVFSGVGDPDEPVFAFITSPRDIHPAVLESGRRWAADAGAMVYLPALLDEMNRSAPSSRRQRIIETAEAHNRATLDRLIAEKPAVIAVDDGPRKLGIADPEFDYIDFFGRYAGFEDLWKSYEERERIGKFRIFVRTDAAAAGA